MTHCCAVRVVCVMLANCPSAGAVPDVNNSGQGMCFCNCYSLWELHKRNT